MSNRTISITISPGTSQTFTAPGDETGDLSGNDGAVFEKARAWLKDEHIKAMQAQHERRLAYRAEKNAAAKAAAGAAETTLTPDTVVVKSGAKGGS